MTSKDKNASSKSISAKKCGEKPTVALMKNPFLYIGTVILLIVSIPAMIFVSGMGKGGSSGRYVFGSYAGQTIDFKQDNYLHQMVKYFGAQQQQSGSDSDNAYFQAYQVWRQAFERTVIRIGLLDLAQKAGLTISDSRLTKEEMKLDQYQEDGKFSLKLYKAESDASRAMTRANLKENLLIQDYLNDFQSLSTSPAETQYMKAINAPLRSFNYVRFPFSAFPDDKIRAFGTENAQTFKTMKLSYIRADKSKALATGLRKEIIAGIKTFTQALENTADKGYSGIEGIDRAYWEIKDIFEAEKDAQAIFALKKGEYSPLLKTKDGEWVFYFCDEEAADVDLDSQEQRSKIWSYIAAREKGLIEEYYRGEAQTFISKAASGFEAAVKEYKLETKEIPAFAINYGSNPLIQSPDLSASPELAGIASNAEFLNSAFALKAGELSKPLVVGDSILVLRFEKESVPEESALSSIDFSYSYYLMQYRDNQLSDHFLKSPRLKDDFGTGFQRVMGTGGQ